MIDGRFLCGIFLRNAVQKCIWKKAKRKSGQLKSKPEIEYELIPLDHCIIKKKKSSFNYNETGISNDEKYELVRLHDEKIQFSPGDKIIHNEQEYFMEGPPSVRDRIPGFSTVVLELKHVGS